MADKQRQDSTEGSKGKPDTTGQLFGPLAPGFGLSLGGGGVRGGYQIGVWEAMREFSIPITGVVGSSIGSINAAAIALDDYETARRVWQEVNLTDIIKVTRPLPVPQDLLSWRNIPALTKMIREDHGLDTEPLRNLLDEYIDEHKLRERGCPYGVSIFSLTERKPMPLFIDEIPEGQLTDYILASCALPFFKATRIDGNRLLDGGFSDNLPTSMLTERGWKKVIEVEIHGLGRRVPVQETDVEIIRIEADNNLFGPFNLDKAARDARIKMGYTDAVSAFKKHGLIAAGVIPAHPLYDSSSGDKVSASTGDAPDKS